jgi:Flp pilus assembly pilin Flp
MEMNSKDEFLFAKGCPRRFLADTRGAAAVEYGLIVALLSLAIVAMVFTTGDGIKAVFSTLIVNAFKAL